MRIFAQKPKKAQQKESFKSKKLGSALSGRSSDISSILYLQRTIGNQAAQRLLTGRTERHQSDSESESELSSHANEAIGSSGQPLSPEMRPSMDRRFGFDFSKVRIHSDSQAAQSAAALNARAYTVGSNIVFGAGEYAPRTRLGRSLIAHELAHVVQQAGTQATIQGKLRIGSPSGSAEQAADAVANSLTRTYEPVVQREEEQSTTEEDPLTQPLNEQEWESADYWQSIGRVEERELTEDTEQNALLVAEAIFCRRMSLRDLLEGQEDPLLCVESGITRSDPRVRRLMSRVTARGAITPTAPLTDEEWDQVERWKSSGNVGIHRRLTEDQDENALLVAEAIFCRRMSLRDLLEGQEDPILCIDSEVTRSDSRVRRLLRHVTARGPIYQVESSSLPLHPTVAVISDAPEWITEFATDTAWPVHSATYEEAMASGGVGISGLPETWDEYLAQMGEMTFLGHQVVGHRVFLERLDRAQRYLRQNHPEIPAHHLVSGVGFPGARSQWRAAERLTASPHLFGMAIDINAINNPWMSNPAESERNSLYAWIIWRAVWLMGRGTPVTPAESHSRAGSRSSSGTGEPQSTADIWRYFNQANLALLDYLALAGNRSAIEERLESLGAPPPQPGPVEVGGTDRISGYIPTAIPLAQLRAGSVEHWVRVIQHDRDNWPNRRPDGTFREFMNLRRELVIALRDYGGLQWGACDLGESQSGDMMHFALDPPAFFRFRNDVRTRLREARRDMGAEAYQEARAEEHMRRHELTQRGREEHRSSR